MFQRTIYAGSGAHLSLVGYLVVKEDHILIIGPAGEVRIDGSFDELRMVQDFIRRMDGFTPLSSLISGDGQEKEQQEALLTALSRVGALLDRAEAWRWFHELSSNPPVVPTVDDPMAAYSLPRLAVSGIPYSADLDCLDQTSVDILASHRESADLRSLAVTPDASLNSAVRLATNAYLPRRDGRRPVASDGARGLTLAESSPTAPRSDAGSA
jgi:hypothetical protein